MLLPLEFSIFGAAILALSLSQLSIWCQDFTKFPLTRTDMKLLLDELKACMNILQSCLLALLTLLQYFHTLCITLWDLFVVSTDVV